jgi:sigma-E factor negative regulatory protein RseA
MTQELSSLMDGELEAREAERAIVSCCGSEELKLKWQSYHLIGEAMLGEGPCRSVSTRRIVEAIAGEPTVLAPHRRLSVAAGRIAFAAAASVATLAVVAWIGVQGLGAPEGPSLARNAPAKTAAAPHMAFAVVPLNHVDAYLVAHRQLPGGDFYRTVSNQAAADR